jgi:DNA-binding Lrp family transcriptional regulator
MRRKESKRDKEKEKNELLKLISVNSRLSISEMSKQLGIPKLAVYKLIDEVTKEYDLKFVPEINIPNIWKYEFIRLSKSHSKKELLHEAIEKLHGMGFEEYIILFKFSNSIPTNEEINKALGGSYMPQFISKLQGESDLLMYAIAPNFTSMGNFVMEFATKLKNYNSTIVINKIFTTKGFFPLRNELIKEFNVSSTYQRMLIELNKNGRCKFKELADTTKISQQQLKYAFERLIRANIIERITYYERKPSTTFNVLISIKAVNLSEYLATKDKWMLDEINDYANKHDAYSFICDVTSPFGALAITSFNNKSEFDEFSSKLKTRLKGVEIKTMPIKDILLGHIGIRDFDMRYSNLYKYLERKRLVPRFTPSEKILYDIGEANENINSGMYNESQLM